MNVGRVDLDHVSILYAYGVRHQNVSLYAAPQFDYFSNAILYYPVSIPVIFGVNMIQCVFMKH